MKRLWNVAIGCTFVAFCCFGLPGPESKAGSGMLSEVVVTGTDAASATSPVTEGVQLTKSANTGEKPREDDNWQLNDEYFGSRDNEPTKVKIRGNSVLVPVTLAYGGNKVDVQLLLDTGSTATVIYTEIANQLYINLTQAKKVQARVVGGDAIDARLVRISRLTVGPHTKRDWNILVVSHKGSGAGYDGLLGTDVLRTLKYKVDFSKQVIIWE